MFDKEVAYTTKPIDSLEELIKWQYDVPFLLVTPLRKCDFQWDDLGRKCNNPDIPQIIYCHDMAGGYLQADKTTGFSPVFPAFRFTKWHLIDIFIYFSHHFITLPPISWINLAHRQGVRVYGTLIIESSHNYAFQTIFANPSSSMSGDPGNNNQSVALMNYEEFAHRLNEIRRLIGFEGWLINFEASVSQALCLPSYVCLLRTKEHSPAAQRRVASFLRLLKSLGSEVVWYDAMCWSGWLNYQNCLTDQNRPFLEACQDGLFLNYNWNADLLRMTQRNAGSALVSSKVFVGIDCFGRGCPGGGGFGTATAMQIILDAVQSSPDRPLSVALFAPGWVFEKCQPPDVASNPPNALTELSATDWRFWSCLEHLIGQLKSRGQKTLIHRPSLPCLPVNFDPAVKLIGGRTMTAATPNDVLFETDCCTGQGCVASDSGGNCLGSCMSKQQILPTCRDMTADEEVMKFEVLVRLDPGCGHGATTCLWVRPNNNNKAPKESTSYAVWMELFTFGSETILSPEARLTLELCFDPVGEILNRKQQQQDNPSVMALELFADCGNGQDQMKRTIVNPVAVPPITVIDHKIWLCPEYQLPGGDLALIRLGLRWNPSTLLASAPHGFLIGQIRLVDPLWPLRK